MQSVSKLKNLHGKKVILRLDLNVPLKNGKIIDTTRIDIMANFFAKTASQNGVLKLFAGGKQIKSLVPIIDVARCFKFMEEKNEIKSEIFNLTKEFRFEDNNISN